MTAMKTLAILLALFSFTLAIRAQVATPPEKPEAPQPVTQKETSMKAGYADGYLVGKTDAVEGRPRDGKKARRLGGLHSQDHEGDKAAYALGYLDGYYQGWDQRKAYKP